MKDVRARSFPVSSRSLTSYLLTALLIFSTLALSLLSALPAAATMDLISPADSAVTNHANLTFDYYVDMPGVQQCVLHLDQQEFLDITIQNASFNSFNVINVDEGLHNWSIQCSNSTSTEYSVLRSVRVDRHAPTLTIIQPAPNATVSEPSLSFISIDNNSQTIQCSVSVDNNYLLTINASNNTLSNTTLNIDDGDHLLTLSCFDEASNGITSQYNFTLERPLPPLALYLHTNKELYALGEQIILTIDTLPTANVSLEICPDVQGFVQCSTPIITPGFPQTIILPYTNVTGDYLIEGTAIDGNRSVINSTSYTVENSMSVHISADSTPRFGKLTTLQATAVGGIGDVTYKWTLHNNTVLDARTVDVSYDAPGTWTEHVTAIDAANNTANANYTVTILPTKDMTVLVLDADSGQPLDNATVQIGSGGDSETIVTNKQGKALFTVEEGRYDLFVSKDGYDYYYGSVESNDSVTVRLQPRDSQAPVITIKTPVEGKILNLPVHVSFHVDDQSKTTCRVNYAGDGSKWLQQGTTIPVEPNSDANFDLTALSEGKYALIVECTDASNNIGKSGQRSFTVSQEASDKNQGNESSVWDEEDPLSIIDQAYGAYDGFTLQQRELADLLGFEERIKEAKLTIERALRDRESLKFRRDLSSDEKESRSRNLTAKIKAAQSDIPLDIAIIERKEEVRYLSPEELADIAQKIIQEKGYAFSPKQFSSFLARVQNSFSVNTVAFRAKILLPGNRQEPLSLVTHRFSYHLSGSGSSVGSTGSPGLSGDGLAVVSGTGSSPVGDEGTFVDALRGTYTIYELVPTGMALTEKEAIFLQEHEVLHENPLALEFPPLPEITYYVEKDVPVETLLGAKSILLKKPSSDDLSGITGRAFLVGRVFDWKLSLLLTLLTALLIAAARRFSLFRHLRYLFYAESGKAGLHAIKTVINDGLALLEANDLERAMMRYKEAKLEYEHLGEYAKNEVYPELIELKRALDASYFNVLTRRIQEAMESGRYEDAVEDYARLEGTFEELGEEERRSLIAIVSELGRRISEHAGRGGQSAASGYRAFGGESS